MMLPTDESTERWQESKRRPKRLLVILNGDEEVIDPGYIRHIGPGRDPEIELYQNASGRSYAALVRAD